MASFAQISKDNSGQYKMVAYIENPERTERVEFKLIDQKWVQVNRAVKLNK